MNYHYLGNIIIKIVEKIFCLQSSRKTTFSDVKFSLFVINRDGSNKFINLSRK